MAFSYSPLRYPGGKTAAYGLVAKFITANNLKGCHYVEPYAGGCGLALALLYSQQVSEIHINDLDKGIWSFWYAVLNHPQELIRLIKLMPVSVLQWEKQKEISENPDRQDTLTLGFATFFLNRTNRAGIINKAGMIGGKAQAGNYKLDSRFNKENLINRIARVAKYKNRIHLSNQDAIDFMQAANINLPLESLFFIDPPYFKQGASLYTHFYNQADHSKLAQNILQLSRLWLLTYDDTDDVKQLYRARQFQIKLNYYANVKRLALELLFVSDGLKLPRLLTKQPSFRLSLA